MREEEIHCGKDFRNRPDTGRVCWISVQMGRGGKSQTADGGGMDTPVCALGICTGTGTCAVVRFLSFYETADASMQAFLDEVCVCMRNHQNPSGQKIWQDCLQKHKRELQIGQEGWEILTSAAGAFYGESSAENLRCNEICRKRMEKFLAESRLEFLKTAGVSACWNADRRGYDHSSGVKA